MINGCLPANFGFQFIKLFRIDAPFDYNISVWEAELDFCKQQNTHYEIAIGTLYVLDMGQMESGPITAVSADFSIICH